MKQNTTTNDELLFWYSLDMEHRTAKGMALTKKASSNKADALIPLEVPFFTIYIHFSFVISIPHTRNFVLLHYSTVVWESNN